MKNQERTACECFSEVDRMINEGLGNGTVDPRYTEAHLKLKEKQERLYVAMAYESPEERSEIK